MEAIMVDEQAHETTDFCGVRITENGIASVKKGEVIFSLSGDRIRNITLRYGFRAEHPFFQVVFGLVLIAAGLVPLRTIIEWLIGGGTLYDVVVLLLSLLPLGIWLLFNGLRRGYYLLVCLTDDKFKIPFRRKSTRENIVRFVSITSSRYGYEFRRED